MAGKFEYNRQDERRAYAEGRAASISGAVNPHATTSRKWAAWQAGLTFAGTRDSTALGAGGWRGFWTGVTFDGANDWLANPTNLGLADNATFTAALAFRLTSLAGTNTLASMNAGGLELATVAIDGAISVNGPFTAPATTNGFTGWTSAPGVVEAGVDYVLHIAADHATDTVQVCLNGAVLTPSIAPTWHSTTFGTPTQWTVGAGLAGANKVNGLIGLAWYDVGQYIVSPAAFFPARDLGAQLAVPGARPAIGFGGVQTAANWNAGTNLGDGTGTWTMNGSVT